jgi:hypothetical protein
MVQSSLRRGSVMAVVVNKVKMEGDEVRKKLCAYRYDKLILQLCNYTVQQVNNYNCDQN